MAISKNALDVNDLVKLAKSSPQGANAAVAAAWENLKIATGEVLIPIIIPALLKLAQAMRDMGQWIDRHPIRFEYIVKGFAGLGAAMAITGTLMLVTAGFKALGLVLKVGSGFTALLSGLRLALTGLLFTPLGAIVAGISAVVVVGYEVYKHWDVIKPKLLAVWDGIKSWISGILDWLQGVGHNIMGGSSAVASSKPSYAYAKTGFAPPSSGGRTVQVSTQLNVDGRTIARAVTDHQYYDMNRDLAAGGGFDGRLSFASPGVP